MKKSALPLVCLLVGAAAGYGLRYGISSQHKKWLQRVSAKNQTAGTTSSASAKSGKGSGDEATNSKGLSLTDQIQELLVDYDWKSGMKVVRKLTVEELQSALALVAAMPKPILRVQSTWR